MMKINNYTKKQKKYTIFIVILILITSTSYYILNKKKENYVFETQIFIGKILKNNSILEVSFNEINIIEIDELKKNLKSEIANDTNYTKNCNNKKYGFLFEKSSKDYILTNRRNDQNSVIIKNVSNNKDSGLLCNVYLKNKILEIINKKYKEKISYYDKVIKLEKNNKGIFSKDKIILLEISKIHALENSSYVISNEESKVKLINSIKLFVITILLCITVIVLFILNGYIRRDK